MPNASDEAEVALDAAQNGALLRDLPLQTIHVTGPDRASWLNGLVTCDLAKLGPGDAAYGLLVAKNGKIQSEVYLCLGSDRIELGVRADRAADLAATLDRYLVMEDAALEVATSSAWMLALGPRAADVLAKARAAGVVGGLVRRASTTAAILTAPERAAIAAAVASDASIRIASDAGWQRVRVELGIPALDVDFDDASYPQEASLEGDAVSFSKGCYLGQEAVFMLEKRGHVKKRLVQLLVDGDVEPGDAIEGPDGQEVGKVTSAASRPWRNLALGHVKYKHAAADTELRVRGRSAVVTSLLAIKPEG